MPPEPEQLEPDWDQAYVPPNKLTGFLLNPKNRKDPKRGEWFLERGYTPPTLEQHLLQVGRSNAVSGVRPNPPYETLIEVIGVVVAPNGEAIRILTAWELMDGKRPKFVTAHPD